MNIEKIQIKNYRSIEDSGEIGITKLFALIGKNNTGKSALVDAIQSVWDFKRIAKDDFHMGTKESMVIMLVLCDYEDDSKISQHKDEDGNIELVLTAKKNDESGKIEAEYHIKKKKATAKTVKEILPRLLIIPAIRTPQNETTAGSKSYLKELISSVLVSAQTDQKGIKEIKGKIAGELNIEQINILLNDRSGIFQRV